MDSASPRPVGLRKESDDRLVIDWSDGHKSVHTWANLRKECPCAGCREERQNHPDPCRLLKPSEHPPLKPVRIEPVGYYAYKIVWSDGHDAGLFTLEHPRRLCECAACRRS